MFDQRNRLTEDSQILSWGAADVTPEDGQTTKITVMDADRNILAVHSGITGTSYEVPLSSFFDGGSPSQLVESAIVRVTSERDGLESLQGHEITIVLAALTISGTPVLTATEGSSYAGFTVSASYGTPPYSYSLVGDWPAGISVDSSTGAVSGTPTEVGSFTGLSVRVTDAVSDTDDLPSFTLEVADGSTYYAELTIAAGEVSSDLTDFPVYVDLSDMPAGFWSHVKEDGGDIRVKTTGGALIPFDLVWFNHAASDGLLYFKRTVATATDTVVRIHYGDSNLNLLPAVDTNGRNAVWSDYDVVIIPGVDIFNRTGKSQARAWGYPQTFELLSSVTVTGHEGVIPLPNGEFVVLGSNALRRYNAALDTVLASNLDPAGDTGTAATDVGGGCVGGDGRLYISVGSPSQIAVFDASTLAFIETFDTSGVASPVGGPGAYCPVDGYLYGAPYVFSPGTDQLYKFDPATGAHVGTITMSEPLQKVQGAVWYGNALFLADDNFDRHTRVELDGTVTVGGLFGNSGTILEDGGPAGGFFYTLRNVSGENSIVEKWKPYDGALGGGACSFTSDARLTAPISAPGTVWSLGVSLSRNDGTTRVAVALATASASVGNVAYIASGGARVRAFFDASNSSLEFASTKNPAVGTMARVNVVYDGTTERRGYYNGGDKVTDSTITAVGSTVQYLVYGSDRYDTQSFSWRGKVGFAYLRMSALSDAWIAAEYSNLNAPSSFYAIGAEQET
ncbi:Ig domain-containing protein [Ensifer sp. BR816]|uniref:Ig domain-containing protein n=1 Tax=Rhizobium sp. (strain BR816) TaxID=1057002 RepID=UPI00037FDD17|nr:Ig domain-containing protein [Ensifer sp. BR816]